MAIVESGAWYAARSARSEGVMNYRVRIIKRGRDEGRQSLPPGRDEKTTRQSEREIAGTVKGWIAEWERRRRAEVSTAFALVK